MTTALVSKSVKLPKSVLAAADTKNWRAAVSAFIAHKIESNLPFSSGELAAELRTHRPDLAFSVIALGDFVRDMFYAGAMDLYDDGMGGLVPPCQIPCTTQGIGRTPAGQIVFVYGPDPVTCQGHPFEVDIPLPGVASNSNPVQSLPSNGGTPAALTAQSSGVHPPSGQTRTPVQVTGSAAPGTIPNATVHIDGRLCVARGAFEAFVLALNHVMRGGDPVYVRFDGNTLVISLDAKPGTAKYDLAKYRGRVLVTPPNLPLQPGDKYAITVDGGELKVDLSQAV